MTDRPRNPSFASGPEDEMAYFRPVGGSNPPVLALGMQGFLYSVEAVAQEFRKTVDDMATRITRSQQVTESGLQDVVRAIKDLSEGQRSSESRGPIPTKLVDAPMPDAPPAAPDVWSAFEDARSLGTVKGLKQAIGIGLQNRIGNFDMTRGLGVTQLADGSLVDMAGNVVDPDSSLGQTFMRRSLMMSAGRAGAQALATGKPIGRAALSSIGNVGLLRSAGLIGAGISLVNQAENWLVNQRAINADWMSMTGGGQMDAIGERIGQRLFGFSQFGVMSGKDAAQLYRGVVATGLQGEERQEALSFATRVYRDSGVGISESLQLVQLAARSGIETLAGLAATIEKVGADAKEAGANAEVAREQFYGALRGAAHQFGGEGAVMQALALQEEFGGYSGALAELGYGNLLSDQFLRRVAGQQGITLDQLRVQQITDPRAFNRSLQAGLDTTAQNILQDLGPFLRGAGVTRESPDRTKTEVVIAWSAQRGSDLAGMRRFFEPMFSGVSALPVPEFAILIADIALGAFDLERGLDESLALLDAPKFSDQDVRIARGEFNIPGARYAPQFSGQAQEFLQSFGSYNQIGQVYGRQVIAGADYGGIAEKVARDRSLQSDLLGKQFTDSSGKTWTLDELFRSPEGIRAINAGQLFTDIDGQRRSLASLVGAQGAEYGPRGQITVVADISPELQRLLNLEFRYDERNSPPDPHAVGP